MTIWFMQMGTESSSRNQQNVCRMTCCVHRLLPLALHCMLSVVASIDSGGPMIQDLGTHWQLEWQSLCRPEIPSLVGGIE